MTPTVRVLRVIDRQGKYDRSDKRFDSAVDHLSEYDAIVLDPTWSAMFGGRRQEPGTSLPETTAGLIDEYRTELLKRRSELVPFFQLGGVLVVRVDLPAQLTSHTEDGWSSSRTPAIDTHDWFTPLVQDHSPLKTAERLAFPSTVPELTQAGSGRIEVTEPGHPFERYLTAVGRYRCRIGRYVRDIPGAVVLAESRMGDVVAVEVPIAAGSAVLVPPPQSSDDEQRLEEAVQRAVAQRVGARNDWLPPQERVLIERRDDLVARMRTERSQIDAELAAVRAIKARVVEEEVVARSRSYYRQATAPGVTPERSLGLLYKVTDLLRDYFGGGERGLADALGMTVAAIKNIKKVADLPERDLRHAHAGPTEQITDEELRDAVQTAYRMIDALITRRVTEELSSAQPQDETPA